MHRGCGASELMPLSLSSVDLFWGRWDQVGGSEESTGEDNDDKTMRATVEITTRNEEEEDLLLVMMDTIVAVQGSYPATQLRRRTAARRN